MNFSLPVRVGLVMAVLVACAPSDSNAGLVVSTSGTTDPVSAGFQKVGGTTWAADSSIEPSWRNTGSGAGAYLKALADADFTDLSGWTATARFRSAQDWHAQSKYIIGGNRQSIWQPRRLVDLVARFSFSPGGIAGAYGWNTGYSSTSATLIAALDVSSFHTYQMVFDPADQSVHFYVDGAASPLVQSRSDVSPDSSFNTIQFGSGTSAGGDKDSSYAFVQFETGQHIISAVPEPSALAFMAIGSIGLLPRLLRRQRQ